MVIAAAIGGVVLLLAVFLVLNKRPLKAMESSSPGSAQELYAQAMSLEEKNETLAASDAYQKLLSEYPDFNEMPTAQKHLESLNMQIIFSATETPKTEVYEVNPGDSLVKIAKHYKTTVELIKKSNNLTSDTIRAGQHLRIWKGVFSVFVDKSQNTLMLKSDNEIVKIYNVSTGKNNSTPVGTFKIVDKLVNPVWFKSGAIVPPESPENILGTRWMGFDFPGYGIHGTTDPNNIGQQVTAGCVRMRNSEVEELYSLLPVGTAVTIVD